MTHADIVRGVTLSDLVSAESVEAQMLRKNPHAYAQTLATMNIEGYDFARCEHPGCTATIALKDWDIDGPDAVQPDGIKCSDDHWACNVHTADRKNCVCAAE